MQDMVRLYRKTDSDALNKTCTVSVVHSTACDLSINDYLLSTSFREKLTSGIKRFIPHTSTRKSVR